jgi:hypothetical protein
MSQSGKGGIAILWRRTLTTMTALWFSLVATVRIIVCLRGGTWVVEERVVEKVVVAVLRVAVWVTIAAGVAIEVAVLVTVAEPLLEEGSDVVDYSAKLLVAVSLGGLKTTGDMSANKGHRYGV